MRSSNAWDDGCTTGIVATLNDYLVRAGKPTVGFWNPFIYQHPEAFFDCQHGCNFNCQGQGFCAQAAWDPVQLISFLCVCVCVMCWGFCDCVECLCVHSCIFLSHDVIVGTHVSSPHGAHVGPVSKALILVDFPLTQVTGFGEPNFGVLKDLYMNL